MHIQWHRHTKCLAFVPAHMQYVLYTETDQDRDREQKQKNCPTEFDLNFFNLI